MYSTTEVLRLAPEKVRQQVEAKAQRVKDSPYPDEMVFLTFFRAHGKELFVDEDGDVYVLVVGYPQLLCSASHLLAEIDPEDREREEERLLRATTHTSI